jgi:hypothetical protein
MNAGITATAATAPGTPNRGIQRDPQHTEARGAEQKQHRTKFSSDTSRPKA